MKGILMFDNAIDAIFCKGDEHFQSHLLQQANAQGLIQDMSASERDLDKDILLQLFAPILTSHRVLQSQFGSTFHSIETDDGIHLIFQEFLNHVVIGVSSTDKLSQLRREIIMFTRFVSLLYGPSLYLMKECLSTPCGLERTEVLSLLFDEYMALKKQEQMFVVEAIERCMLDSDTTAKCVHMLQGALHKIRVSLKDGIFNHAFLLVETKLLALYSSRNSADLPKDQLLLLIALAKVLNKNIMAAEKSESSGEIETGETKLCELSSLLVFLKMQNEKIAPHIVYVTPVNNDVTLVILCEMVGRGALPNYLESLMEWFDTIQKLPNCHGYFPTVEDIEATMENLSDFSKQMKISEESENKFLKDILIKWEQAKKCAISDFMECPCQGHSQEHLTPRLDASISSLLQASKIAFGEVVTRHALLREDRCLSSEYRHLFSTVLAGLQKQLKECPKMIEKNEKKLIAPTYISEFPGLLYFIYIDRSNGCIIAQYQEDERCNLKSEIWHTMEFSTRFINGETRFLGLWHKENKRHFHSIWFEDANGKQIAPTGNPKDFGMEDDFVARSYRSLIQRCFPDFPLENVYCYELFCIYNETTSDSNVLKQTQRLSAKMWELSGAFKTPLDLL